MNVLELANFICGKVNESELEDVAQCKGFLRQRFDMLWRDQLWKDSLVEYAQTLSPTGYTPASNWLPTRGILLLPPIIDRVLAVRTNQRKLNVQRAEFYYRIDYDAFAKTGQASDFLVLPQCVWDFETAQAIYAARYAQADNAAQITTDLIDSDGIGVSRYRTMLTAASQLIASSQRIDSFTKLASTGNVALSASGTGEVIGGVQYNAPLVDGGNYKKTITGLVVGQQYIFILGNALSLARIVGDLAPENYTVDSTFIAGGTTYVLTGPPWYADPAAAPPLNITSTLNGSGYPIITLGPTETNAKHRQRIRLLQIPTDSPVVRVLGKRTPPSFTEDLDEPGLSGIENCLIAFAQGDMLQRARQYAKAQAMFQEATLLLQQLKSVEVVQQAHHSRIVPEHGYGDDFTDRIHGFSW